MITELNFALGIANPKLVFVASSMYEMCCLEASHERYIYTEILNIVQVTERHGPFCQQGNTRFFTVRAETNVKPSLI